MSQVQKGYYVERSRKMNKGLLRKIALATGAMAISPEGDQVLFAERDSFRRYVAIDERSIVRACLAYFMRDPETAEALKSKDSDVFLGMLDDAADSGKKVYVYMASPAGYRFLQSSDQIQIPDLQLSFNPVQVS